MSNMTELLSRYESLSRKERQANDDMYDYEFRAEEQYAQLEKNLAHRAVCIEGLKRSGDSWLSVPQQREYKLLLQHLELVIESAQYKVDASKKKYQQAKKSWLTITEHLEQLKLLITDQEDVDVESERLRSLEMVDETGKGKVASSSVTSNTVISRTASATKGSWSN